MTTNVYQVKTYQIVIYNTCKKIFYETIFNVIQDNFYPPSQNTICKAQYFFCSKLNVNQVSQFNIFFCS